jgi:hypothetical protein
MQSMTPALAAKIAGLEARGCTPLLGCTWQGCITQFPGGEHILWYNTPDHSTHVTSVEKEIYGKSICGN